MTPETAALATLAVIIGPALLLPAYRMIKRRQKARRAAQKVEPPKEVPKKSPEVSLEPIGGIYYTRQQISLAHRVVPSACIVGIEGLSLYLSEGPGTMEVTPTDINLLRTAVSNGWLTKIDSDLPPQQVPGIRARLSEIGETFRRRIDAFQRQFDSGLDALRRAESLSDVEHIVYTPGEARIYRATRDFALRSVEGATVHIQKGELLRFDGMTVTTQHHQQDAPGLRGAVRNGWIRLEPEAVSIRQPAQPSRTATQRLLDDDVWEDA